MSRKTAVIEEFDDDTDLPLPTHPLENTGTHGPLLELLDPSDDDEDSISELQSHHGSDRPSTLTPTTLLGNPGHHHHPPPRPGGPDLKNTVTDITPYKKWSCIYPIYIDAKRSYGRGQRRIERAKSVWWPLSKDIADAVSHLGLGTLHEVNKSHPRDWANPGRVRVQWKEDGDLVNPTIKTKKQLLEMISCHIQKQKPEIVPTAAQMSVTHANTVSQPQSDPDQPSSLGSRLPKKGKQQAKSKSRVFATVPSKQAGGRKPPAPPEPYPPMASRVSPYSPALETGMLVEAVRAGMNATEGPDGSGSGSGSQGVAQKGKRKVIRVRS